MLGDGQKFFEDLGHIKNVQPVCHLVAFFIPGSGKRGISSCVPARVLGQFGNLAIKMDKQIDELIKETESVEETDWTNIALNSFHVVATIVNAFLWICRPRIKEPTIENDTRSVVRRARRSSLD